MTEAIPNGKPTAPSSEELISRARSLAIERLFEVCPPDEIRLDRPIQRLLRDLIAFTHQGAMAPHVNWERYGRHLTGASVPSVLPPAR